MNEEALRLLRKLHAAAGYPPTREIAAQCGVSHTTVAIALRGKNTRWRTYRAIVQVLDPEALSEAEAAWVEPVEPSTAKQSLQEEIRDLLIEVRDLLKERQ